MTRWGNRLSEEKVGVTTNYTYDIANRLTQAGSTPYTWDNNGNLLSDGTNTYSYINNKLSSVINTGPMSALFPYIASKLDNAHLFHTVLQLLSLPTLYLCS